MNVINFGSELDSIPTANEQQRADARSYLERHAPTSSRSSSGSANPDHLEPVTHQENMRRANEAQR